MKLNINNVTAALAEITKAAKVSDQQVNDLLMNIMSHTVRTMDGSLLDVFIKWSRQADTKAATDYPKFCHGFIRQNTPLVMGKNGLCTKTHKGKNALKRLNAAWGTDKDAKATITAWYKKVALARTRDNQPKSKAAKKFEREALLDDFRTALLSKFKSIGNKPLKDGEQPITREDVTGMVESVLNGDEFKAIAFNA